jgi:anti-sigma factor RsiW
MCPDRDLVSAYVDGEVPSPWRERLEEHFVSCPDCAALAARYASLGERLRIEKADGALSEAFEQGRSRLDALLSGLPAGPSGTEDTQSQHSRESSKWRRSISLPLPIAAAAAILVLLLGGATTLLALKPASGGAAIRAVASGEITPSLPEARAQPASMEELLRYLDSSAGQVTLTINLPNGATFGSAGKPVIMRSGQAIRGTTVEGHAP